MQPSSSVSPSVPAGSSITQPAQPRPEARDGSPLALTGVAQSQPQRGGGQPPSRLEELAGVAAASEHIENRAAQGKDAIPADDYIAAFHGHMEKCKQVEVHKAEIAKAREKQITVFTQALNDGLRASDGAEGEHNEIIRALRLGAAKGRDARTKDVRGFATTASALRAALQNFVISRDPALYPRQMALVAAIGTKIRSLGQRRVNDLFRTGAAAFFRDTPPSVRATLIGAIGPHAYNTASETINKYAHRSPDGWLRPYEAAIDPKVRFDTTPAADRASSGEPANSHGKRKRSQHDDGSAASSGQLPRYAAEADALPLVPPTPVAYESKLALPSQAPEGLPAAKEPVSASSAHAAGARVAESKQGAAIPAQESPELRHAVQVGLTQVRNLYELRNESVDWVIKGSPKDGLALFTLRTRVGGVLREIRDCEKEIAGYTAQLRESKGGVPESGAGNIHRSALADAGRLSKEARAACEEALLQLQKADSPPPSDYAIVSTMRTAEARAYEMLMALGDADMSRKVYWEQRAQLRRLQS